MKFIPGKSYTIISNSLDYADRKFIWYCKLVNSNSYYNNPSEPIGVFSFMDCFELDNKKREFVFLGKDIVYEPMPYTGGLVWPIKRKKDIPVDYPGNPNYYSLHRACVVDRQIYWFTLNGEKIFFVEDSAEALGEANE